jgi:acyl dehydratase
MTSQIEIDIDDDGDLDQDRYARITDDGVSNLRRLVGIPIEETVEPWCYEITRDNIRHYAHGIGDDNPLWSDLEYASSTSFGDVIAPPSFVFALNRILSGYVGGLPGVHAMWAGADLTWHRPMIRGTDVQTNARLKDLIEHETRFAGRAIQQIYQVELLNAERAALCTGESWCFRTERDAARQHGTKYAEQRAKSREPYSSEELRSIYELYDAETIRGAQPRYLEDVDVGDEIPQMVKGPMTVTGFIAFAQGWGGLYIRANKIAYKQIRKHPGLGIPNSLGVPDVPERVHWEKELAADVGTPGAYDYGPERFSWLTHQITNWMGDEGFLRRSRIEIRHHNIVGDWLKIIGRVTSKGFDEDGNGFVIIEQQASNQRGDLSAHGVSTVWLPSKGR